MAEAEGKNFSGRISKLPLTSLFNFLRLWDNTDSFIAQKWPACNLILRRFDEFSTCEIPVFSWSTCQHFWDLPLLLLMCVQLCILAVFSDHSPFLFSLLPCFWGSCSHHHHSCCVNKAAAPKTQRLYTFLLLLKQSFQSNLRGQKGFDMPDLMLLWDKK